MQLSKVDKERQRESYDWTVISESFKEGKTLLAVGLYRAIEIVRVRVISNGQENETIEYIKGYWIVHSSSNTRVTEVNNREDTISKIKNLNLRDIRSLQMNMNQKKQTLLGKPQPKNKSEVSWQLYQSIYESTQQERTSNATSSR